MVVHKIMKDIYNFVEVISVKITHVDIINMRKDNIMRDLCLGKHGKRHANLGTSVRG